MASHIFSLISPIRQNVFFSVFPSSNAHGHGGHKISTLEKDEREKKNHFNSCFQWLIKEMKCIMMAVPLHVHCCHYLWCAFLLLVLWIFHLYSERMEGCRKVILCNAKLTALLWFQNMNAGGSGELCTTQVRLMVEPLSMYKSGAPIISVDGSAKVEKKSNQ